MIYQFGDVALDDETYSLQVGAEQRHVEPLVFDLIVFLAQNPGRVVNRDDLIAEVWGGRIVSDTTIASCVKSARQALGDDGKRQDIIRTVRGRGFQFVAEVERSTGSSSTSASAVVSVKDALLDNAPAGILDGAPSIAVLPLHFLTPHTKYNSLGDAVSQEIIVELARLHWMFVISRGSSFSFRGPDVNLKQVSEVLGVRYILSGTLAIHDSRSVVTIELAQGEDGRIIWAERFEQPLDELLLLKSQVAANIVSVLEARIQTTEAIRAGRLSTENLDAWSAYHRGLWHMFRFNQNDNAAAQALFSRAIEDDPQFARAHAGLSFTHFQNAFLDFSQDRREDRRLARSFAEKSHELDPLDPFVNLTMGRSAWIEGDLEGAMPWLNRSIDLSPNYAFAIYNQALLGVLQGETETSEGQVARAISLSPIDPLNYAMLCTRAMSNLMRGDFKTACEWATRAIHAPRAHFYIYLIAAIAHEKNGQSDLAKQHLASALRLKPDLKGADLFRAFPFADEIFRSSVAESLSKLNIS